jgi:hypothetical protein
MDAAFTAIEMKLSSRFSRTPSRLAALATGAHNVAAVTGEVFVIIGVR